ncbi:metallopeptidase family protein [Aestuariimicrobium ganziense]|uniref:metallopeptidase family protein n=1 Tax=Aestuariimicrobium ganziense TaxID=2773677 RepID=UPI0019431374|nr:metallopeptidase family protein [Aestuariimicrobium ganziense]
MARHRDRHGRGMRGPLAAPNPHTGRQVALRWPLSRAEWFVDCLEAAIDRVNLAAPEVLGNITIAMEEVPTAMRHEDDRVPLASAIEASGQRGARIVLYRRPLEHRSTSRRGLRRLVHRTLVEQVAALTGRSILDLDPDFDEDDDTDD